MGPDKGVTATLNARFLSSASRRGRWSQAEQAHLKKLYGLRDDAAIARELNRPLASVRRMAEKLFSGTKTGPWTAGEAVELKKYLGATSPEIIAQILGRSVEEVNAQIMQLGRMRRDEGWTCDEIAEFKRIYGRRTDKDLSRIFGRAEDEICQIADEHALAKDKAFIRKLNSEASTRMPRWAAEEIEVLKHDYPQHSNLEIARKLGRSVKAVVSKAHHLRLKKSLERLREMGRKNVSLRYHDD